MIIMAAAVKNIPGAEVVAVDIPARVSAPPPLALYLHFPWCVRKCPYCDFNSHKAPEDLPEEEYVRALLADAERALPDVWGRRVCAGYFGGGTPSLFSPRALEKLLSGLRALFNIAPDMELTMEANPGSADAGRFAEYRALGVSRLSLGAQSFDDGMLAAIGRAHDGAQAKKAAEQAAAVFDNFNLDLMHALPGQTEAMALADLRTAADFSPRHLSLYQLTLEPGTPFFRRPPARLPDCDSAAQTGEALAAEAESLGYCRYEVSAFAREGGECAHNLNYWRFGDYLGLGAGAHGKVTVAGRIFRQARIKDPREYMRRALADGGDNADAVGERREVCGGEAAFEFLLNALRLVDGFAPGDLFARAGATTAVVESQLQIAECEGLIERTPSRIRPTVRGARFLNDLLALFLPPEEQQ